MKMRVFGVALLACSLLFSGSVVCAESERAGIVEETKILYQMVTVERSNADVLSESMRWHVFVGRYGDPGFVASDGRDYYEDIVPTHGQPPVSSDWQPGDRVIYTRRGTDGQYTYTRETIYERHESGAWGMPQNTVKRVRCAPVCPSVF